MVLSTPRSGWFTCAGERGPGIALWMALLPWMAKTLTRHDIVVVTASGIKLMCKYTLALKNMLSEYKALR